jgi:transposase
VKILGMDLGQSKSAWELLDTVTGEASSGSVGMDESSLGRLLKKLAPERLVIESGPLAARVHDLAVAGGVAVQVADTTEDAWQWKNVKRKTDADDAGKLARLSALGQINPVHIPAPAVRERRHLLEYRRSLLEEQTRCKNRIRATLVLQGLKLPPGKSGWSLAAREELRAQTRPLAECGPSELWRGVLHTELEHLGQIGQLLVTVTDKLDELCQTDPHVALLTSIPGVGPRTAEVIVTVLDQPRRFSTRRQVSAYAGLVPRRFQSGQMDRSGRITKRGSPLLRQTLNQAAWIAVRCNPALRTFFLRISGGSKRRRKQAIVAVMRKLLVLAWAMLRDGKRYRARPSASNLARPSASNLARPSALEKTTAA